MLEPLRPYPPFSDRALAAYREKVQLYEGRLGDAARGVARRRGATEVTEEHVAEADKDVLGGPFAAPVDGPPHGAGLSTTMIGAGAGLLVLAPAVMRWPLAILGLALVAAGLLVGFGARR